jgi:diadenosine tetraphosphate (Ap4A) HIT family hydrolase
MLLKKKQVQKLLTRPEYYELIKSLPPSLCLFCEWQEHQIILSKSKYWVWIASNSPYWKYHTMFVPKRHIVDLEDISTEEFEDLKKVKQTALAQYEKADYHWPDGSAVSMFCYTWRVRQDGFDEINKVTKSAHLHIHMSPEQDNRWTPILDPEATKYDFHKLKV